MRIHSQLNVFKNRIEHNLQVISKGSDNKKIIPMLKAEAYGHGILGMLDFLNDFKEEISYIGVASLAEAQFIKFSLTKPTFPLLVFSELGDLEGNSDFYSDYSIIPVISDLDFLRKFLSKDELRSKPLFLKFNTGMNRLGLNFSDLEEVINLLKKFDRKIDHLMSHYSSSYLQDSFFEKQNSKFLEIINEFKASSIEIKEISIDNSASLENKKILDLSTHTRPGLMLYGPQSTFKKNLNLNTKIISNLETQVINVRAVKAGEVYGYGNSLIKEDGLLLIIPLGYGDGISTNYSGLNLSVEDQTAQVFGRVNMDLIALFVSSTKKEKFKNKKIIIWNEEQKNINRIAKHLSTHPYEVFCLLSSRLPRVYLLE